MLEYGTTVEADTRNSSDGEFDRQHIARFTHWVIARCAMNGLHCAVGKGLRIKARRGLGILFIPDANGVLGCSHCVSFPFKRPARLSKPRVHLWTRNLTRFCVAQKSAFCLD